MAVSRRLPKPLTQLGGTPHPTPSAPRFDPWTNLANPALCLNASLGHPVAPTHKEVASPSQVRRVRSLIGPCQCR